MVSVIAKNIRNRRQHKGKSYSFFYCLILTKIIFPALCELFDKADTGGDGTISIQEYIAMCEEYGIELTEEHLEEVRSIANEDGEVKKEKKISNNPALYLGQKE